MSSLRRLPGTPGARRVVLLVALGVVGAVGGMLMAGRTSAPIGPFDATVQLQGGRGTTVALPPLGSLQFDTHVGPVGLGLRADELRPDAARRVVADPDSLEGFEEEATDDLRAAVRTVAWRGLLGALVGALALAVVREWSRRAAVIGLATALVVSGISAGSAALTWEASSIGEPRYTGLLAAAPRAVGSVRDIQARFDAYRSQLSSLISNVAGLYQAASSLDAIETDGETVRILHVSDLHLNPQGFDLIEQVSKQFKVDAVVDTGDIVDWGTGLEGRFTDAIGRLGVPYVYVRGNHDSVETAAAVALQENAVVLDGDVTEVEGIRIWGVGDPRFTPDKSSGGGDEGNLGGFAAQVAEDLPDEVDVALVHDPKAAAELGGKVPLVLAGHLHRSQARVLRPVETDEDDDDERPAGDADGAPEPTRLLVEGSTGGAGLRALEGDDPEPLSATVLHLDRTTRRLLAYDRVVVSGLGGSGVSIERRLVPPSVTTEDPRATTTVAQGWPAPGAGARRWLSSVAPG